MGPRLVHRHNLLNKNGFSRLGKKRRDFDE